MSCILSFQHVINTTLLTLYTFSLPNLLHVSHVFSSGLNTFQVLSTHTCKQPSCGRAEKRRHWRRHLAHLMCHALPHIPSSLQANHIISGSFTPCALTHFVPSFLLSPSPSPQSWTPHARQVLVHWATPTLRPFESPTSSSTQPTPPFLRPSLRITHVLITRLGLSPTLPHLGLHAN